ncbi:hypothetical protein [Ottowia sp.]|uniref:hypothetical protein n=1 Tax=Ottowia sp. TaxID=1898956 RepID=UPI003A89D04F
MSTVGIVLATIALTFLGLFLLLKLGIGWWFKRLMKDVPGFAGMVVGQQSVSARITMTLEKLKFTDSHVYRVMSELKALGYQSAGRYTLDELPGVQLWAGTHPENGSLALVFEANDRLFSVDLIRFYDSGAVLGAGTNPNYNAEDYPSDMQYRPFPADTPMKDLAQWLAARPRQATVVMATPQNLRQLNTRMYAHMMDYRLSQSLPSFETWKAKATQEVLAHGHSAPKLTDAQWHTGYAGYLASFEEATEEALKDHLLRSGAVTALEWEEVQYDLAFVYERLSAEGVAERALGQSEWTPDESRVESLMRQNLSHQALFEAIQDLLPPDERFHYLADVHQPLAARVYRPAVQE